MQDLAVYFLRHNLGVYRNRSGLPKDFLPDETMNLLTEIWDADVAVLDYKELPLDRAYDPEAYREHGGHKAIGILNELLRNGGYVAIVSHRSHPNYMKIGRVFPVSTSLPLRKFEVTGEYLYKAVPLIDARTLSIQENLGLFSQIPRQAAFSRWPSAAAAVNRFMRDESPDPDVVTSLHASQLEVLCYEYLRANEGVLELLMPIGRSMQSVDIVARDGQGGKVWAQVTFHHGFNRGKFTALRAGIEGGRNRLFYFGAGDDPGGHPGIEWVKIEEVFSWAKAHRSGYVNDLLALS